MGLLSNLLTLPLAPVRGTVWIAEQLAAEAERELADETRVRRELADLEAAYELGEISEDEYERREEELLDRLEWALAEQDEHHDGH
jgi:ADP-ribose pyrophosphatase YjhB (NUDIX family)